MQKTRLGISVGLMGALSYFAALFGGYVPMLLIMGYVLWCEANEWLRLSAVKSVLLSMCFSVINMFLGFIPDLFSFINSIFNIFGSHFSLNFVSSIVSMFSIVLSVTEKVLFLLLGFSALKQGTLHFNALDRLIQRHMPPVYASQQRQ